MCYRRHGCATDATDAPPTYPHALGGFGGAEVAAGGPPHSKSPAEETFGKKKESSNERDEGSEFKVDEGGRGGKGIAAPPPELDRGYRGRGKGRGGLKGGVSGSCSRFTGGRPLVLNRRSLLFCLSLSLS